MILTVSPTNIDADETVSTLNYANMAKMIINQPTKNTQLQPGEGGEMTADLATVASPEVVLSTLYFHALSFRSSVRIFHCPSLSFDFMPSCLVHTGVCAEGYPSGLCAAVAAERTYSRAPAYRDAGHHPIQRLPVGVPWQRRRGQSSDG